MTHDDWQADFDRRFAAFMALCAEERCAWQRAIDRAADMLTPAEKEVTDAA